MALKPLNKLNYVIMRTIALLEQFRSAEFGEPFVLQTFVNLRLSWIENVLVGVLNIVFNALRYIVKPYFQY